mmetsp:Transcript_18643/g.53440  ORF Transcript_18643/g.53440 Transcript_18643/m.53440 type:complete len:228 (+) Transcript_18643:412-1095(+)
MPEPAICRRFRSQGGTTMMLCGMFSRCSKATRCEAKLAKACKSAGGRKPSVPLRQPAVSTSPRISHCDSHNISMQVLPSVMSPATLERSTISTGKRQSGKPQCFKYTPCQWKWLTLAKPTSELKRRRKSWRPESASSRSPHKKSSSVTTCGLHRSTSGTNKTWLVARGETLTSTVTGGDGRSPSWPAALGTTPMISLSPTFVKLNAAGSDAAGATCCGLSFAFRFFA